MTTNEQRLVDNIIQLLKEKKNEFSALWFYDELQDSVKLVLKDKAVIITIHGTIVQPYKLNPEGEDLNTIITLVGEIVERDRLIYIDKQNEILESYLGEVEDKGKIEI